ncbi:MAG: peptidoglycan-binding protein, partial [Pseudolabrys sp.]|nr:peptidoglycan-binding protein [Pseudolabrys sp.]
DSLTAGKNLDAQFGWTIVGDPATGARIGLPSKMVPVTRDLTNGTRWASRHGDIQVETFRVTTSEAIAALFERYKREPATRRTEYSLMKPDNFFISGMQGLKKFSLKAQLKDGELRGFVAMYDQAIEGIMAPAAIAMTTAYTPFPDAPTPYATLSKRVEYGTALVVSAQGHLIADRNVTDNCQVIVASGIGNAERVATDDNGLALLRVYGANNLSAAPLAADAAKAADLTLIGIADPNTQDGDRKRSEVKAKLSDSGALELRQSVPVAGFSGAAAFDAQGRVLGTMQTRNAVIASADAPAAPPVRLITAAAIRKFLGANGVTPATAGGDTQASVIRVICVRK